jgi:biopolymer transport protein ExbB
VLDRYKMLSVHNVTDREKRISELQKAVEEATLMETDRW